MLRLADRIITRIAGPAGTEGAAQYTQVILQEGTPIIVADNIVAHDTEIEHKWDLTAKNYPRISPPFQGSWFIEWQEAGFNERGEEAGLNQRGSLFQEYDTESMKRIGFSEDAPEGTQWLYIVMHYVTADGLALVMPKGHMVFVAKSGELLSTTVFRLTDAKTVEELPDEDELNDDNLWNLPGWLRIPLLTIAFMHCSNVSQFDDTKVHGQTPKWHRRQRVPELKYQTLWIGQPGSKRSGTGRTTEGDRSGKSLHICRGHFAHYAKEGGSLGLFGRGTTYGTFWIPSHARGSLEHGEVRSTYKIA
jgi:hypothetical protein